MTQSNKHPTVGFRSGHDLAVREFDSHVKLCADSSDLEFASNSVFPSQPFPLLFILPLSLSPSQN